ncbi:response regulator [Sphaerimonospora cavernae]|uniref:Response regulator n=1 Tax=Sphaerimonospora cavernae TaxID=1740611 RepID=A0ABV6U6J8_9ACTN
MLIADDHPIVREGLRAVLGNRSDVQVVAEVADGAAAIREAVLQQPDIVLLDLQMPGLDGLQAARRLRVECPGAAVLVLTMYDDDASVLHAMQAGARGYLLKGAGQQEILHAIHAVHQGQAIFGAAVAARITTLLAGGGGGGGASGFPDLTFRERQILGLVAEGHGNAVIAQRLGLSRKTIANHLSTIYRKIQVSDRPQAIVKARAAGLGQDLHDQ